MSIRTVPMTVKLRVWNRDEEESEGGWEKSTARRWAMRAPLSWPPRMMRLGEDEEVAVVLKTFDSASRRAVPTERLSLRDLSSIGVEMPYPGSWETCE